MAGFDDGKDDGALRTIGEVSEALGIRPHVLRYWEAQFPLLKPLKRSGGRRYYRPEDIALLKRVGDLLYNQGYTIKGVQRLLRDGTDEGPGPVALELPLGDPPPATEASEALALKAALTELEDIARALHRLAA